MTVYTQCHVKLSGLVAYTCKTPDQEVLLQALACVMYHYISRTFWSLLSLV